MSVVNFENYYSYSFEFEKVELKGHDIHQSLCLYYTNGNQAEPVDLQIIPVHNWQEQIVKVDLHDFDLDDRILHHFVALLDSFFMNHEVRVSRLSHNIRLAVYQSEYFFEVVNDSYYILGMFLDD